MFEIEFDDPKPAANILVVGVGGSGGNAVNYMAAQKLKGAVLAAVNTDVQDLDSSRADHRLLIGEKVTRGLGTGGDPELGRQAAEASAEDIKALLEGYDMVFVTCGMGGGTGTGAGPVVAKIAKELGLLVVAVVTKPFSFEGRERMEKAKAGLAEMSKHVDSLIVISNDKLLRETQGVPITEAFRMADDILYKAVRAIVDIIQNPGYVNRDFADVRRVMENRGMALIGVAEARGDNRAVEAVRKAVSIPLLDEVETIEGAKAVLVNITTSPNPEEQIKSDEIQAITDAIQETVSRRGEGNVEIFLGISVSEEVGDSVRVAVIATGLDARRRRYTRGSRSLRPREGRRPVQTLFEDYQFNREYEEPGWGGTGSLA